jgi:osomolarity two-component system, sensor histidine kinase SLN1
MHAVLSLKRILTLASIRFVILPLPVLDWWFRFFSLVPYTPFNCMQVARYAAHVARGLDPEKASEQDGDGHVVGDETRLMQIITNLASNACKFTPPGGRLRITTRLVVPACSHRDLTDSSVKEGESGNGNQAMSDVPELSAHSLARHDRWHTPQRDWIVVRIEVTDTGYGIPPKEMVQSNLFCGFRSLTLQALC